MSKQYAHLHTMAKTSVKFKKLTKLTKRKKLKKKSENYE